MEHEPLNTFLKNLWQISGGTSDLASSASLINPIVEMCLTHFLPLKDLLVTELGRSICIVAYCNPDQFVLASQVDQVRDALQEIACSVLLCDIVYAEVVVSSESVFSDTCLIKAT